RERLLVGQAGRSRDHRLETERAEPPDDEFLGLVIAACAGQPALEGRLRQRTDVLEEPIGVDAALFESRRPAEADDERSENSEADLPRHPPEETQWGFFTAGALPATSACTRWRRNI